LSFGTGFVTFTKKIGELELDEAKKKYPEADVLIHPECGCSSSCMLKSVVYSDCKNLKIFSTEGMMTYTKESASDEFLIATEVGILHRLKKENPAKSFYPASENSVCEYMKMITMEKLYNSLLNDEFEVKVPEGIAAKARISIERMLSVS